MKVNVRGLRRVFITGGFIKLDSLLKLADIASTGGEAKIRVLSGEVFVNGEVTTQRGKKIRPGDIVRCGDITLVIAVRES